MNSALGYQIAPTRGPSGDWHEDRAQMPGWPRSDHVLLNEIEVASPALHD
jgi:hypothetical protein